MPFDFKKEYKEFYSPSRKPSIITLPSINYVAVRGKGDPNDEDGEYKRALEMLYTVSYTLKMSYKGDYRIEGYFEYVVPPLEGLWWFDDGKEVAVTALQDKSEFNWISMIRVPDFIREKDLDWAKSEILRKKKTDCSAVEFMTLDEGLCAQILHVGPYDDEPATIAALDDFITSHAYAKDFSPTRRHHEIYLSDPRKSAPDKLKTVIRVPIKKAE